MDKWILWVVKGDALWEVECSSGQSVQVKRIVCTSSEETQMPLRWIQYLSFNRITFSEIPFLVPCSRGRPQSLGWEKVNRVILTDCLRISEPSPDVSLAATTNDFCKCVYSLLIYMNMSPCSWEQRSLSLSTAHSMRQRDSLNEICFCFGGLIFIRNGTWLEPDLQNKSNLSFMFIDFLDDWVNEEITLCF